jgi:pimeloyl-ACP methyl ester carboxylesterase
MHHYQLGSAKKPALVILHGWGLEGSKYKKLAQLLSSDFQVIVPDLPGFGETKEPTKAYTLSDYAKKVKSFLKEKGIIEAHFVGHSFGGRITMKMANSYPKLVKSLVLTGSPGVEKFDLKRSTKRCIYWVAAKCMKIFGFLPPLKKIKKRFYAKRDFGKLEGVMKKTFLKVIRERLEKEAKKIQQPTLLLWGRRDQMAPARDAQKMLKIIPHSYLKIFTRVGHKLPYEKPYEFSREVAQFVDSQ